MKTKMTLTAMALVIAMTFFACKGDTGAAGPAGANGVSGLTMTTYTVQTSNWNVDGSSGEYWDYVTSTATSSNNVVEVYYSTNGTEFLPLPAYNEVLYNTDDNMIFGYGSGNYVTIVYFNPNSNAPNSTVYINVAVIPQTQMAKMKQQKIDMNDYNQINAYIKLNSK